MMNLPHTGRLHGPDQHQIGHDAWWTHLRAGFARFAAARAAAWTERRKRARDRQVLADFSDRELWDIGISRSDIPGVLAGTFHRD
jgi:uncharacterized protein YjiS (DUF1127 family)